MQHSNALTQLCVSFSRVLVWKNTAFVLVNTHVCTFAKIYFFAPLHEYVIFAGACGITAFV